jgi:drug/metabolite transporter (DMT)-like permease
MLGAIGTTLLFACNAIFANRSAQRLGSNVANAARLAVAVLLLGAWAHVFGQGLRGDSLGWFLLSGLAGFGIGGVAMFHALPRLGSPLAMLIVQCGSALLALAVEWVWLGTRLTAPQLALVAFTLAGVGVGLMPKNLPGVSVSLLHVGAAWAFLSAAGQGLGAVLSRKAFQVAAAAQETVDPATSAYQRALAGLAVAVVAIALARLVKGRSAVERTDGPSRCLPSPKAASSSVWPWVLANALCGPVLGVTCFQWALRSTPAGIVQSIVATAPLVTIPLALWLEQARPRPRYYVGALLAVLGVAGLFLAR